MISTSRTSDFQISGSAISSHKNIQELEKIEMTRQTDNVYRLDHAVTAKQKKILKAFGMNEGNITYRAGEISNTLRESGLQKERR